MQPIPEPIFHQVLTKPVVRTKKDPDRHFSILTPKLLYKNIYDEQYLEKKRAFFDANPNLINSPNAENIPLEFRADFDPLKEKDLQKVYHFTSDQLINGQSRWILPAKKTLLLIVILKNHLNMKQN